VLPLFCGLVWKVDDIDVARNEPILVNNKSISIQSDHNLNQVQTTEVFILVTTFASFVCQRFVHLSK